VPKSPSTSPPPADPAPAAGRASAFASDAPQGLSRKGLILLAALGALLAGLLHLPPGRFLASEDWTRFHVFNREYLYGALRAGRLPLWNPHVALGRPFLADVETAFLYPPHLLYLALAPESGAAVLLLLHAGLLCAGMALLARALGMGRIVAAAVALAFVACGAVSAPLASGQVLWFQGIAYLPLVLRLAMRLQDQPSLRRLTGLALLLALQLLGTHPQLFWMQAVGVAVFLMARGWPQLRSWPQSLRLWATPLLAWLAAHAWASLLAAAQYLPFLELVTQGNRQARSLKLAGAWSLGSEGLASLLFPVPVGNWSDHLFSGSAVVALGVGGMLVRRDRNARALTALAVFATVLALGTATPLLGAAVHLLPGLSLLRVHGRFGMWTVVALLLLAGLLLEQAQAARRGRILVLVLSCLAALVALIHPTARQVMNPAARVAPPLALGLLCFLWLDRQALRPSVRTTLAVALAGLTLFELGLGTHVSYGTLVTRREYPAERPVAEILAHQGLLQQGQSPPRVSLPFPFARENAGMRLGWSTFSGYSGLWLERTWSYVHQAAGLEVPTTAVAFPAANVYRSPFPLPDTSLVLGLDPQTLRLAQAVTVAPRAQVVGAAQVVPGDFVQVLRAVLRSPDLRQVALVEEDVPSLPANPVQGFQGSARVSRFAPEMITVQVEATHPALLILGEAYYPGWTAQVGGREIPCLPANAWMRAVPIPAGKQEIIFHFHSTLLIPGALLSILSLALALVVLRRRA
jgi:hypothetical protein